jgi:hypothetical protein
MKLRVLENAQDGIIFSDTQIQSGDKNTSTNVVRIVIGDWEGDSGQGASIFGVNGLFPNTAFG